MTHAQNPERTAERLRREFDDAFVRERGGEPPVTTDLLEIRVAGQAYGVLLDHVAAVLRDRRLVKAPSPRPDLLGLANLSGSITPVHDLSRLLGHAPCPTARWLAQIKGPEPFAVAFDHYERHLRILPTSITKQSITSPSVRYALGYVSFEGRALRVIDLLALQAGVTRGAGLVPPPHREELR